MEHLLGISYFVAPGSGRLAFLRFKLIGYHHFDAGLNDSPRAVGAGHGSHIDNAAFKRCADKTGIIYGITLGMLKEIIFGRALKPFGNIVAHAADNTVRIGVMPAYPHTVAASAADTVGTLKLYGLVNMGTAAD